MKKIFRLAAFSTFLGAPLVAAAQTGVNVSYLQNYSNSITGVINYVLVPVLMAIAFIVFLWGVYKYFILGAADEKSRTDGRQFTLWGVIGFVVILSLWGIVNIFMSTLGLSVGTAPAYPTIGNVGGSQSTTGNSSSFGNPSGTVGGGGGYVPSGSVPAATMAQQAYNNCILIGGGSPASCQSAYTANGGTGTPTSAYGAGGTCPAGYVPDDNVASGCAPDPSAQYGAGGTCPTGYVADDTATSGCSPVSTGSGANADLLGSGAVCVNNTQCQSGSCEYDGTSDYRCQ